MGVTNTGWVYHGKKARSMGKQNRLYTRGGGCFLLIYLGMVVFLGAPLMLSELSVGRASQTNIVGAFRKLGHPRFSWVGWMGVTGAFIITCYYSHVGGWVLRYVVGYAAEAPKIYGDSLGYFYEMLGLHADGAASFPWLTLLFAGIFMAVNAVVITGTGEALRRFFILNSF